MSMDSGSAQIQVSAGPDGTLTFSQVAPGVRIEGADHKPVTITGATATTKCSPCVLTIDQPAPSLQLQTPFDWWVLFALCVPLVLATIFGCGALWIMFGSKANCAKTIDKLAQLLSEGDTSKMSMSRVQAPLFTYVIGFGTLLIIARTGQFPPNIPTDLAILTGGGLATYVVSKAIQGSTDQGPKTPPAQQQQQQQQQQPH